MLLGSSLCLPLCVSDLHPCPGSKLADSASQPGGRWPARCPAAPAPWWPAPNVGQGLGRTGERELASLKGTAQHISVTSFSIGNQGLCAALYAVLLRSSGKMFCTFRDFIKLSMTFHCWMNYYFKFTADGHVKRFTVKLNVLVENGESFLSGIAGKVA